jgi:hypothetical protein
MEATPQHATETDLEQLRVLSVLWFVYGGLAAVLCLFGVMLAAAGLAAETVGVGAVAAQGPAQDGWPWNLLAPIGGGMFLLFLGGTFAVIGGALAALRILTGLALRRHRNRTLCLVGALLSAMTLPLGTLLGIATLLVVLRPGVENLFLYGYPVRPAGAEG